MPAPLITRNWNVFEYVRGKHARTQYLATGYSDAESVRSASPVQEGDEHELDGRLIANVPRISTPEGPQNYHIDIEYERSGDVGSSSESDLDKPPTYKLEIRETSEPIDRDRHGNPITNSVGDPFAQNNTKQISSYTYWYKRYESNPDVTRSLVFSNTVNDGPLYLPGAGTIEKGQGRLISIAPQNEADRDTDVELMMYLWELRKEGFKTRNLDKGRRGYWSGGIDAFYAVDANGKATEASNEDVLLDGSGQPLVPGRWVVGAASNASTAAQPPHFGQVEPEVHSSGVFLRYEIYDEAPHGALQLEE